MTVALIILAVLVAAILTLGAITAVASHRERLRRLTSPMWRARQTEARIQAATTETMRQMTDIAQQTIAQRRHR